jgi:hypothetical protein
VRATDRTGAGFSALELIFVVALMTTVAGMTVPPALRSLDDYRAAGAARYVAARLQRARMEAVMRSADVGVKFTDVGGAYTLRCYVDGNRNGVLTHDIDSGADRPLGAAERLPDNFAGVDFGTTPGLPAVDAGGLPPGSDPIRLGSGNIATFGPNGTSSSGSLYVKSRTRQYVVRIYGDTGKTRLLVFDPTVRVWKPL